MPFTTPNAGLPAGTSANGAASSSDAASPAVNGHHANGTDRGASSASQDHVDQYDHSRVKHYIGE